MVKNLIIILAMLFGQRVLLQQRLLFLVAGQSNGVGQGDRGESVNAAAIAYEYSYGKNSLKPLADPVGQDELHFQAANTGSAWPAFAKTFHSLTGKKLVLIPAARGGSSCSKKAELHNMGTWDTSGMLPLFDSAIIKARAGMENTRLALSGIIWSQGERDANAINAGQLTVTEYEQTLKELIARFRKAFARDVNFYIIQTGYYRNHPRKGFDEVRRVQESLAKSIKGVYLVYDKTGDFEQKGWMKDDIHYSQAALNDIGAEIANKIAKQN